MKSFLEIAEELGVSKQAVYKRYRGKLYKSVFPYVRIVGGTTYIMEQGENIIKQDYISDNALARTHTECIQDTLVLMLQRELRAKNRHIAELANIIQVQTKTIKTLTRPKPNKKKTRPKLIKTSGPIERLMCKK